jgi:hypothetical protein
VRAVRDGPILVVHMPHTQGRVACVALPHFLRHGQRFPAVGGMGDIEMLAGSEPERTAVRQDREDVRVLRDEPGRRDGVRSGQVHAYAVVMQQVHNLVQPAKVVHPVGCFQPAPRKDGEGDKIDPGLLHKAHILLPHLAGPLLWVVVPAVGDTAQSFMQAFKAMFGCLGLRRAGHHCPLIGQTGHATSPPLRPASRKETIVEFTQAQAIQLTMARHAHAPAAR